MLRSSLSAWLAEHIISLTVDYDRSLDHPLWAALVRVVPACHNVSHSFIGDKAGRISYNAALKGSRRNITFLELCQCSFLSVRIALRMLADISMNAMRNPDKPRPVTEPVLGEITRQ